MTFSMSTLIRSRVFLAMSGSATHTHIMKNKKQKTLHLNLFKHHQATVPACEIHFLLSLVLQALSMGASGTWWLEGPNLRGLDCQEPVTNTFYQRTVVSHTYC